MKFFIKTDASILIGSGHVMRCLVLAEALKSKGHEINFICRHYPGNLIDLIKEKGFFVYVLPFHEQEAYQNQESTDDYSKWLWVNIAEDADQTIKILENETVEWLVTDCYALNRDWEKQLRPFVDKIMVIDDLADRQHDCDILLDQNFYLDLKDRYDSWVSSTCLKLLGPQYALIRPEFTEVRQKRETLGKCTPHPAKNILVYMGGADMRNYTAQIIQTLLQMPTIENYHVDILVGAINPHKKNILALCDTHAFFHYHEQPAYYFDLLCQTDLAIAAGGASTYERCYLRIPSLVLIVADNQSTLVKDTHEYGAHYYLKNTSYKTLSHAIHAVTQNFSEYFFKMTSLVDGLGISRVCQAIEGVSS